MIDWTKILPLDKRSKQSVVEQIASNFMLLIQNQILGENQSLPSIQELADKLGIATETIHQAYDFLMHHDYVYRYQGEVKISESELLNYELPKPFTPNLHADNKKLKVLETEIVESKVVEPPNYFKRRFGEIADRKALYTKRIYHDAGKPIIMIESYYFMTDANDDIGNLKLGIKHESTSNQFADAYETTRELSVIKAAEELHKIYGKGYQHIAKDFYIIKKNRHSLIEFGHVYTITKHLFKRTLTDADFLFIF